jgi:hypothetical protein
MAVRAPTRARAALGTAATWAVVWALGGVVASPYLHVLAGAAPDDALLVRAVDGLWVGWYGFLAGLAFAGALTTLGRRRAFSELTAARMARWAVVASAVLVLLPMWYMLSSRPDGWRAEDAAYLGAAFALTLICAVGSLLVARRAVDAPFASMGSGSPRSARLQSSVGRDLDVGTHAHSGLHPSCHQRTSRSASSSSSPPSPR